MISHPAPGTDDLIRDEMDQVEAVVLAELRRRYPSPEELEALIERAVARVRATARSGEDPRRLTRRAYKAYHAASREAAESHDGEGLGLALHPGQRSRLWDEIFARTGADERWVPWAHNHDVD